MLDDEPIGDSFETFVEDKQMQSRKISLQSANGQDNFAKAVAAVMEKFQGLGITRQILSEEGETECQAVADKIAAEPDEDMIIVNIIKSQSKDQKAQQSYESNMDVQGFGNTMTSGFFQTQTSGFGERAARPQSAFMRADSMNAFARPNDDGTLTEAADDEDEERRAQE